MFDDVKPMSSKLTEGRPHSLYAGPDFGGKYTMRARVIGDSINEIPALRQESEQANSDRRDTTGPAADA